MTQREAIIRALEKQGWRRVPSPSRTYVKLEHSVATERPARWVGKNGALRVGRTVSKSFALVEKVRRALIRLGEDQ